MGDHDNAHTIGGVVDAIDYPPIANTVSQLA